MPDPLGDLQADEPTDEEFQAQLSMFLAEEARRAEVAKLEPFRKSHLQFMQKTWTSEVDEPFCIGFHTVAICNAIDEAVERFRKGESTFLQIKVPPRHGKSSIVSRYLAAHFLGEFPTKKVMQVSYNRTLASEFSSFGRNLIRTEPYQHLYPEIKLSDESSAKTLWTIMDETGEHTGGGLMASGLTSGLTGSGFSLGILDDFCGSRADAESKTIRDSTWNAFKDDFLTRRARVSIVIVLATQWHWDDVHGRIMSAMKHDPLFPRFIDLTFPAKAEKYEGPGDYGQEYLFEQFFGKDYYRQQYAILGPYSAASLMDCSAYIRTGGRLSEKGIVWEDDIVVDTSKRWARVWDLAHSARQRGGDDPDWTSGSLVAFEERPGDPVLHLYIKSVKRTRAGALERDAMIKATADKDGPYITQGLEISLDTKDAAEYLAQALKGYSFTPITVSGDKGARATPLEVIFATEKHVHVQRAPWNDAWLDEALRFDGMGKDHDDQIDNLSAAYILLVGAKPQTFAFAFGGPSVVTSPDGETVELDPSIW
jgi:predicted phage terminase large subunit-like protein